MAPASLEAGVLVSCEAEPEVETLLARRARTVPRVVIGAVAACSMLGLLAWSVSGGVSEMTPATPLLAYVLPARLPPSSRPASGDAPRVQAPSAVKPRAEVKGYAGGSYYGGGFRGAYAGSYYGSPGDILVQGGSLRTWTYKSSAVQHLQVVLNTEGRPLDADVELWQGPDNVPTKIRVYGENGLYRPFSAVIATPNGPNTVAIKNKGQLEFPISADVHADYVDIPSEESRGSLITVQGGSLRTFPFAYEVDSVQVLLESDGRPINARVELLQGPNNNKQVLELYTEDGAYRPFFFILETPGSGNVVRIVNTGPVEYPIFASVVPNSVGQYLGGDGIYGY